MDNKCLLTKWQWPLISFKGFELFQVLPNTPPNKMLSLSDFRNCWEDMANHLGSLRRIANLFFKVQARKTLYPSLLSLNASAICDLFKGEFNPGTSELFWEFSHGKLDHFVNDFLWLAILARMEFSTITSRAAHLPSGVYATAEHLRITWSDEV